MLLTRQHLLISAMILAATYLTTLPATCFGQITIVQPITGAYSVKKTPPVKTSFTLDSSVNPDTFTARLNGEDVTDKYSVGRTLATGTLDVDDGLRVRTDSSFFSGINILVVSAKTNSRLVQRTVTVRLLILVLSDGSDGVEVEIGDEGGSLELPDLASIHFPAGALLQTTLVKVSATDDAAIDQLFGERSVMFESTNRATLEIRVNTGQVQPVAGVVVEMPIPPEFSALVTATDEIRVFAQNLFDEGPDDPAEPIAAVRLLRERFAYNATTAVFELSPSEFSNIETSDGSFEAIFFLSATPTGQATSRHDQQASTPLVSPVGDSQDLMDESDASFRDTVTLTRALAAADGDCNGTSLTKPFVGDYPVTSPYGSRTDPITGVEGKFHRGVDFGTPEGTPILAAAAGTIDVVKVDGSASGGYGYYMVLKHSDGSKTLYGHLTSDSAQYPVGTSVRAGDQIALSGNTGKSSGPHLHFEYTPTGKLFSNDDSADPVPCFDPTARGSITVSDNGSLADDAFDVAINSATVCGTTVGATNTCAIGNLRPGTATLTILCRIAPDDIGTYDVTLGNGLTFSDGTFSRSGVLPEGGAVDYEIVIPTPTP